jgi:hypothetical protein
MPNKDYEITRSERGYRRIDYGPFIIRCFLQKRFKYWDCKVLFKSESATGEEFTFAISPMTSWKEIWFEKALINFINEKYDILIKAIFGQEPQR